MNSKTITIQELSRKTKSELIEELLASNNGNGKSHQKNEIHFKNSSKLSNLIVENSHDGIMIIDSNQKIEYINKRLIELTGHKKKTILNRDFGEFFSFVDKNQSLNGYKDRINKISIDSAFEIELELKNREYKVFEIRSNVFSDSTNNNRTILHFKDITEQKLAEEAIRGSELKFRSIVENSHLGILIVNSNFQFEYVNDQLCKILQTTSKELEGNDFRNYLAKESFDLVIDRYQRRRGGKKYPLNIK